jgi:polyisoprenoid-binding protein YceI
MAVYSLTIDPVHSAAEFAVTYAMNSIVKGRFLELSGSITLDTDKPEHSSASARIDAASVWTHGATRDDHLRSADFFDVEGHEQLTFESTSVEVIEDNHWHVHGNLSILDQTRPVTLDARYYGIVKDATGETRAGFVAETDIQRSDWGLLWNADQETGMLVSDRVRISLYISARPAEDGDEGDEHEPEDASENEHAEWSPGGREDPETPAR